MMLTSTCRDVVPTHLRKDMTVIKFSPNANDLCNANSGAAFQIGPVFVNEEAKPVVQCKCPLSILSGFARVCTGSARTKRPTFLKFQEFYRKKFIEELQPNHSIISMQDLIDASYHFMD